MRPDDADNVYNNHRAKLRFSRRKFMCPVRANDRVFLQVQRMMDAGRVVLQEEPSANAEQADEVVFHFYERFNK